VVAALVLLVAGVVLAAAVERILWKRDAALIAADGATFVTLSDGRKLRYRVHGAAADTAKAVVLLEGGLFAVGSSWVRVVEALVSADPTLRVITYDRAGLGLSDPVDLPRDAEHVASDAAELLRGLGVSRVVVAAHSLGGYFARILAARNPDLVAGLVLVDTMHPDEQIRLPEIDREENEAIFASTRRVAWLALVGIPRWRGWSEQFGAGLPPAAQREAVAFNVARPHLAAAAAEIAAYETTCEQVRRIVARPDLPITVVSANLPVREGVVVFQSLHAEIAATSRYGRQRIAEDADHVDLLVKAGPARIVADEILGMVRAALAK
jgi:pimeloyl-ACP methyl ester carboxylesterase